MTILNWSFPRKDLSRSAQAYQLALALREEVDDLQKAGCRVIQVSGQTCSGPSTFCNILDMGPHTLRWSVGTLWRFIAVVSRAEAAMS